MKAESLTIRSVSEAIDAMADENLMHDIRPTQNARGGGEIFGLWFRGHENIKYSLTPGILRRPRNDPGAYVDEIALNRHFQTTNPDALPREASDLERLGTMQHYLAPTRLLDWTENLLVALYFAVRNPDNDNAGDAAIWMLNAWRLNYHTSATTRISMAAFPDDPDVIARSCLCRVRSRPEWREVFVRELGHVRFDRENYRYERIADAIDSKKAVPLSANSSTDFNRSGLDLRNFKVVNHGKSERLDLYDKASWLTPAGLYARLRMPIAVYAPRSNRRISQQAGVFTLHGGRLESGPKRRSADRSAIGLPISIEEIEAGVKKKRVAKWLLIPKGKRAAIRRTLAQVGITDATLFPELDYQSKYLASRWTHKERDPDEAP